MEPFHAMVAKGFFGGAFEKIQPTYVSIRTIVPSTRTNVTNAVTVDGSRSSGILPSSDSICFFHQEMYSYGHEKRRWGPKSLVRVTTLMFFFF